MMAILPIYFVITLLSSSIQGAVAEDFYVIANIGNQTSQVSKGELKNIYLGYKTLWNGNKILPARLGDHSPATTEFVKNVVGKTVGEYTSFWRRRLFSGRGIPPKRFVSEQEVSQFVGNNPNGIGFVSNPPKDKNIKVLTVVP